MGCRLREARFHEHRKVFLERFSIKYYCEFLRTGSVQYTIIGEQGKGNYAKIFKAHTVNNSHKPVALKLQKPACLWEYYISKEILCRLNSAKKVSTFLSYVFKKPKIAQIIFKNRSVFKNQNSSVLKPKIFSINLIDISGAVLSGLFEYICFQKWEHPLVGVGTLRFSSQFRYLPENVSVLPCMSKYHKFR